MGKTIRKCMITTMDNPFDPFDEFDEWNAFDSSNGYNSSSYLARIVKYSHELSEADEALAVEDAIDEIISIHTNGLYKKVSRDESE